MADDTEFRDEMQKVLRRHDPDADDLRALADDLVALAKRYEEMEDAI